MLEEVYVLNQKKMNHLVHLCQPYHSSSLLGGGFSWVKKIQHYWKKFDKALRV